MDNENNIPPSDDQNGKSPSNEYNQVEAGGDDLYQDKPSVGSSRTKMTIAVVVLIAFASYIIYSIFSPAPNEKTINLAAGQGGKTIKSSNDSNGIGVSTGSVLPTPPVATIQPPPPIAESPMYPPPPLPVIAPSVPPKTIPTSNNPSLDIAPVPPPPPPPVAPPPAISKIGGGKAVDKNANKRIRSNMMIINGGNKAENANAAKATPIGDPNSVFADNVLHATSAEKAAATGLSNLNMTIAQGKIVNAVLETAINTDLPGTIRAIVSRDTYAEAGRDVLIPKGSRLLGTYNTGVLHGQNRVMVVWTRLIRPDGVDIMIGSPAVDGLGRAGVEGFVDNKFMDIFTGAILTSALTIGAAVAVDAVLPAQGTTTTTAEGNSTTTTSPAQQAAGQAVGNLASISKGVVEKIVNTRPTITVDQGTRINVFVNRDLTFPSNIDGGIFIQ